MPQIDEIEDQIEQQEHETISKQPDFIAENNFDGESQEVMIKNQNVNERD